MKARYIITASLLIFFLSVLPGKIFAAEQEKRAYIITGPESSGSRFIARVISYVVGKDRHYRDWDGYKINGKIGDDLLVIHLSQPSGPMQFHSLNRFKEMLSGYSLYFIITTRDQNIIQRSKIKNHHNSAETAKAHKIKSQQILGEILQNEQCFIWNFETQIYLEKVYFQKLYDFLQISSDFFPPDLLDANKKYMK